MQLMQTGCKNKLEQPKSGEEFIFNKEKAIAIQDVNIFKNKKVIDLEMSDISLIPNYPTMLKSGENFFIYSLSGNGNILRFSAEGKFLNTIGRTGNGPGEYPELYDATIDRELDRIELLSYGFIYRYDFEGTFINSLKLDIPAHSFLKTLNSYWFCTGNNTVYSKYRLFQTDHNLKPVNQYLKDESDILPVTEANFGKEYYLTFRESLYRNVYRIKNDSLQPSYTILTPGLEIPQKIHKMKSDDIITLLKSVSYITVMSCLENDNYVYFMLRENKGRDRTLYHWIINKNKSTDLLMETNIHDDSYLSSPQLLTKDNVLYYLGYIIESGEKESDPELNPSIVMIDISGI
jgi:hypothetical protein